MLVDLVAFFYSYPNVVQLYVVSYKVIMVFCHFEWQRPLFK